MKETGGQSIVAIVAVRVVMSYTDVDYRISDVRILGSSCKPVLTGDLGL